MEDSLPVLATPTIKAGGVHLIQPHFHGIFIRQQRILGPYYLVLNYMKMQSHKKSKHGKYTKAIYSW